jgi:hypothetical protein
MALALLASASAVQAQNTNPTNTFDTATSAASFVSWWGGGGVTAAMNWDETLDAGNDPASGSVHYEIPFVGASGEQFMTFFTISGRWGWDGGYVLDATTYTNLSFDVRVDPSSGLRVGNNDYGWIEVGLVTSGWGTTYLPGRGLPAAANGKWVHLDYPLNPTLGNIDKVVGIFVKMWSNGAHTNTLAFNVDNFMITKPTKEIVIPPPTMSMRKPIPGTLEVIMDDDGAQWQRNAIVTPAGAGPYFWASQGSYPVTYSLTIKDFPAAANHGGFEAHMYIGNIDTDTGNSQTSGAPDWNLPDIFIFRVENVAAGGAMAQIQWKTNYPAANATNIPVVVNGPSVVGTWNVTFTDSTSGTLTGPGNISTNFTIPAEAVALNFSPASSFIQFGMFKNDGANDGRNNGAHGAFSQVKFTGAAAPFEDDFTATTLTAKYEWRKTSATAVQHISTDAAWLVEWTLPAAEFNPQAAGSVLGPWTTPTFTSTYLGNSKIHALIEKSALPVGKDGFFRLIKRPFAKLQVLMPGETAAPNTPTGKTGTPDPQTVGMPFNIIVNAVDEVWNRVKSSDTVTITCSDETATLPGDAALVGGTATLSVTFNNTGTFTVTATDVTDGTKTPGTGSPTPAQ